nr:protein RNA-directed DNA methylation 3-like [Anser cygnoides]
MGLMWGDTGQLWGAMGQLWGAVGWMWGSTEWLWGGYGALWGTRGRLWGGTEHLQGDARWHMAARPGHGAPWGSSGAPWGAVGQQWGTVGRSGAPWGAVGRSGAVRVPQASLDQPTQTVMMHRTEPTAQQNLALQLAEKLGGLVENNERVFDHKQGSYGGYFRDQKDGYRKGDGGYLRRGGYRQQERGSNY